MTSNMKMLRKMQQNERKSLVKELIALRPISPVITTNTHPYEVLYTDTNPPPVAIDQFAPYLSRKLTMKRNERIAKLNAQKKTADPTFVLTAAKETSELPPLEEKTSIPQPQFSGKAQTNASLAQHLKMENAFDKIASGSINVALHRLIESTLQMYFLADKVMFYHDISSVKVLYCPSTTAYCPHGSGLAGFCQFSRQIIRLPEAQQHVSYSVVNEGNAISPESHVLVFPIYDQQSNVKGVVQVVRKPTDPIFTDEDEYFVTYLQHKIKMYSRWLFQPVLDDKFASDLMKTMRLRQFVEHVNERLCQLFACRGAELWSLNRSTDTTFKYLNTSDKPVEVPSSESGIVGFALRNQVPISCITARVHSAYYEKTDGNGDRSILVMPVRDPDNPLIYGVCLRGKRTPQFFTDSDEKILARVVPYVIASLNSALIVEKNHRALKDSMHQQKRLRSLLDVAETLSGQLRMDVLIPNIMTRACELVKADRCSLFMANENRDKLITTFSGGLANAIEIPFNAGIVGVCAVSGEVLNITDAYEDPRFNRATDLATGYRTLTILCVPIFDEKGDVRGVTEMINKFDGVFTAEDEKLIQIFNVFCGISIENAHLYRASIDLSLQLRSFLDISVSLSGPQTLKKIMEDILRNARKIIGAVRAMLFMIEDTGISFTPYVCDEDIEAKLKKQQQKKQEEMEDTLGVKRAIIAKLLQGNDNAVDAEQQKEEAARNTVIERVISTKESALENDEKRERSMIVVPIVSSDRNVYGAVLMQWKKSSPKFSYDDLKLLESYSVFISISLERSRLKTIAQLGSVEVEMQQWIAPDERAVEGIPKKLLFEPDEAQIAISKDFNASNFRGAMLIKVMFMLFDTFGFFKTFKISSEMLYHFLYDIRETYNPVPYHNWIHAVDVAQFVSHCIVTAKLDHVFNKNEIFALIIASVCHDANHDGFSNQYNVRAQTPLGILFKNQSVMETHHCSVSIGILTKDNCNLFHSLDETDATQMWSYFVDLILATDMARHFTIIEAATAAFSKNPDWSSYPEGRMIMMELLIKLGDVSNVARRFEIANRWCNILCEEFFRQGDLEKANGMEYSSEMNDREHLDKAKSQTGFYRSICLPMFELVSNYVPGFEIILSQVKSNLLVWEKRAAEKEEENRLAAAQAEVARKEAERKAVEEKKRREEDERVRRAEEAMTQQAELRLKRNSAQISQADLPKVEDTSADDVHKNESPLTDEK